MSEALINRSWRGRGREGLMGTRRLWQMWWSGLFGIVAFEHLLRAVGGFPVAVGAFTLPTWVSWAVFSLAGLASGWLMRSAMEMPEPTSPRPEWERLGGYHPKAVPPEEEPLELVYCGIRAGGHRWVDEDRDDEEA